MKFLALFVAFALVFCPTSSTPLTTDETLTQSYAALNSTSAKDRVIVDVTTEGPDAEVRTLLSEIRSIKSSLESLLDAFIGYPNAGTQSLNNHTIKEETDRHDELNSANIFQDIRTLLSQIRDIEMALESKFYALIDSLKECINSRIQPHQIPGKFNTSPRNIETSVPPTYSVSPNLGTATSTDPTVFTSIYINGTRYFGNFTKAYMDKFHPNGSSPSSMIDDELRTVLSEIRSIKSSLESLLYALSGYPNAGTQSSNHHTIKEETNSAKLFQDVKTALSQIRAIKLVLESKFYSFIDSLKICMNSKI